MHHHQLKCPNNNSLCAADSLSTRTDVYQFVSQFGMGHGPPPVPHVILSATYTDQLSRSASNALNKWLHANFRNDIVIHGFRHAMRDRLRAVSCPSEMIDQIGGWSSGKVGEGYGEGYSVLQTKQWMTRLQLNQNQGRTL